MRYLFGFMCVLALGVMGCSETAGTGGSGGAGGDGGTGGMPECQDPEDCDDREECTTDACVSGICENMAVEDGTVCDESNECAVGQCASGACELTPVTNGTACGDDAGTCQDGSCQVACTEQGIRDAIAAGGGPYTFDCADGTTMVTEAEIVIDNDVILDGEGNLTVDGDNDHRVFFVDEGVTAELHRLTVTKGGWVEPIDVDESGGGILNKGTLTLTNCSVTQCSIPHSGNPMGVGSGGGIDNHATLTMTNSTVSGNNSAEWGGGISNGGTLTLTNSTVSGNSPDGLRTVHGGTVAITNSTLSDNRDVAITKVGGPGTVTLTNSLVDGGCSPGDPDDPAWPTISNGHNIESPGNTCGFDTNKGDQVSVPDPKLGPLQDNGGPTETHALGEGSVAIDVIPVEGCEVGTDQRGEPRPETGGTMCDVGAFEVQP